MNDYDVSPSEMKRLSNISDSDLDAMRAGHVPHDDPSMDGITRFVRDLDEAFPEPSTAEFEDVHVAAMLQAAHLMAENGELVARPASKANGPENQASGLPKPWRETIMNKLLATRTAKVAAATVAMVLALSGVAIAGVLPDSVQDPVADAVQTVGINLPGGADEVEADDVDLGDVNDVDEADVEDADEAAVEDIDDGDVDDADVDDADEGDADDADSDEGDRDDDERATVKQSSTRSADEGDDESDSADESDDSQEQDSETDSDESDTEEDSGSGSGEGDVESD